MPRRWLGEQSREKLDPSRAQRLRGLGRLTSERVQRTALELTLRRNSPAESRRASSCSPPGERLLPSEAAVETFGREVCSLESRLLRFGSATASEPQAP